MIRVDRSKVAAPAVLVDPGAAGAAEIKSAIDWYRDPHNTGKTFDFKVYKHDDVKIALATLFNKKCAYCESKYAATQPMDVEHWRPKGPVVLQDGREVWPGYYWLAGDWLNLFPSCIDCNRRRGHEFGEAVRRVEGKGSQFPLKDYSSVNSTDDLQIAQPLLLNPCTDYPEQHLEFLAEGPVRPRLVDGALSEMAHHSISTYGLNRRDLVLAREERAEYLAFLNRTVEAHIRSYNRASDEDERRDVEEELLQAMIRLEKAKGDDQLYAQMARQIIEGMKAALCTISPVAAALL